MVGALSMPPPERYQADQLSWTQAEREAEEDRVLEEETIVTPALVRIAAVAGLSGLLFGYDTGVVSGALLVIGTDLGGSHLSPTQESWLVSSALVGAFAGSLLAGKGADRFGRKPVILAASVLFTLGALEQAAAQVYKEVIFGRILVGLGVGLASTVLPLFLAECSPAKYRGRIVASLVVLITGGQVLAYLVDAAFYSVAKGWRFMFGLGAVPAIVQLLLSFSLPESPRHLILHGRIAPARATLRAIYPHSSSDAIQRRIDRIQVELQDVGSEGLIGLGRRAGLARVKEGLAAKLWNDRGNRRALILACGLQWFQQATGFNCLMYFSGKILKAAHFGKPATAALIVAISNFICTIIALRLIDHLGRRPLLLRTLGGMIAGMTLLGFSFFFIPSSDHAEDTVTLQPNGWAYVALLGMAIFTSSYALGLGNVPWVLQSEVFTHELRATGTSLATATNWTANLIVAATYLHLAQALSTGGAFLLFAAISICAWLFTYRYLPETKGLALEETRALFERERWWDEGDHESASGQRGESRARYRSVASDDEGTSPTVESPSEEEPPSSNQPPLPEQVASTPPSTSPTREDLGAELVGETPSLSRPS